jgi:integrase
MGQKHHPENERVKRRYLHWLRDAQGKAPATVDQAAGAIADYEAVTGYRNFHKFHIEQARQYKRALEARTGRAGKPLARATIHTRLKAVRAFFLWLADQPGYKSRIRHSETAYFNPSAQDGRIARAVREQQTPTLEQIQHVLASMPGESDLERRDRALIAFAILSGMRDSAIATIRLRHIDLAQGRVFQDGRCVHTKNRKTMTTAFFPVGDEAARIVTDWVRFLREEKLFGSDDPALPRSETALDQNGLFAPHLGRKPWSTTQPIRKIFRVSFERAGLPYYHPHSFRRTLALLGEATCGNAEEFKAWSQNLGHEDVLTTFTSYGNLAPHRQAEIMDRLRRRHPDGGCLAGDLDAVTLQRALEQLKRTVT